MSRSQASILLVYKGGAMTLALQFCSFFTSLHDDLGCVCVARASAGCFGAACRHAALLHCCCGQHALVHYKDLEGGGQWETRKIYLMQHIQSNPSFHVGSTPTWSCEWLFCHLEGPWAQGPITIVTILFYSFVSASDCALVESVS